MSRLLTALLLAALLIQATGVDLASVIGCESARTGCESACQGERDTQDCSCERCLCCSHHRHVMLTPGLSEQLRELAAVDVLRVTEPTPSADPTEIMHVPKAIGVRS